MAIGVPGNDAHKKKARVQQHGYLTADERELFQHYAEQFGLDGSGLAGLLLARELRRRTLSATIPVSGNAKELKKVTAHLADPRLKLAFTEHSKAVGISPTAAATVVFRTELTEKWLERMLDSN